MAGIKKQGEVAFGNIVGSNLYNILGFGGFTVLIAQGAVKAEIVRFDNLVMIEVSLALATFAWTGLRTARWAGAMLPAGNFRYAYAVWL